MLLKLPSGYIQPSPWLASANEQLELMAKYIAKYMAELGAWLKRRISRTSRTDTVPEGGDKSRWVLKDRPLHDEASHGADAFLAFACSGYAPPSPLPTRTRSFGWVV